MIRHRKIKEDDGNGEYSIFETQDFEFVNPIEHFSTAFIASSFAMMKEIVLLKKPPFPYPIEVVEKTLMKEAIKRNDDYLNEIFKIEIPENFIAVLSAETKKEQVKLLKNQSLTPDQLLAFLIKAHTDFGYSFSQYRGEHNHKGLDETKLPSVIEIKNGIVRKVGETTLTDGQLKQVIEQRKVIVSKFLDKGNEWHCLLLTYDSLKGKESWKDGQSHYHYISNKFGIPRDKVVEQLKSSSYNLGSLPHIDLLEYRDKKK